MGKAIQSEFVSQIQQCMGSKKHQVGRDIQKLSFILVCENILFDKGGFPDASRSDYSQQLIIPTDIVVCISFEFGRSLAEHGLHVLYKGVVNHNSILFCCKYNKIPSMSAIL